jgi:hypothetical protein
MIFWGRGPEGISASVWPQLLPLRQPVQHLGELQGLLLGDFGATQHRVAFHHHYMLLAIDQCHGADADRMGDLNFRMFSSSSISVMLMLVMEVVTTTSLAPMDPTSSPAGATIVPPPPLSTPWLSIALSDGIRP